jgi:hypothetical protein
MRAGRARVRASERVLSSFEWANPLFEARRCRRNVETALAGLPRPAQV